ncbi:MAG: YdiU family protein [Moraxellaceae bacterium]|nr:YdiU family protein [Moraxellaceae bacterium]
MTTSAADTIRLADLSFDDRFLRELPADPQRGGPPRQVHGAAYSFVDCAPVSAPRVLAWSADAAALLGLAAQPDDAQLAAAVFAGNHLLPGMQPYATAYSGHQFGNWAGQLGDGRATTLGEAIGAGGRRWEVQLKGAGRTPYSRHADGRAVLRSSIREYLCSEAMHHLGVPTTRALCLVATGDGVVRDMFYDGHPETEPGAIVTRLSPSFLRFGHFEHFAARNDIELLRRLGEHTLRHHFPELMPAQGSPGKDEYTAFFHEVCRRTAMMIAHWMRVGFVHGVMNTDNMSVLGLSIDYGPYGWLDNFDPMFTPNTTDQGRRYCYSAQPQIAAWNLACLAQGLMPLIDDADPLHAGLELYRDEYERHYLAMLRNKLGLPQGGDVVDGAARQAAAEVDFALVSALYACFNAVDTDHTIFFRRLPLAEAAADPDAAVAAVADAFYVAPSDSARRSLGEWMDQWRTRIAQSPEDAASRRARMDATNPWIIPRNWLAQQAIDAATAGDLQPLQRLMDAVKQPYEERAEFADLAARRPDWALDKAGCSALSCSS